MERTTLYHLALAAEWQAALDAGSYRRSTVGRSLDDEGFIHLSRADQVDATAARYYAGRNDVVLLAIDLARLDAPVVDEAVGDAIFPHLYGPLPTAAVRSATPLTTDAEGRLRVPGGLAT